jgi:hypothetical protein
VLVIAEFVEWCVYVMCEASSAAAWMLRDYFKFALFATLRLKSACPAQDGNQITSLDGAVFPAGLKMLDLVSAHESLIAGFLFVVCISVRDVRGEFRCGVDVA